MSTLTVYSEIKGLGDEITCNLGSSHTVSYHEVRRIVIQPDETIIRLISFLQFDRPGWGEIRFAYDYLWRRYINTPSWDGQGTWRREPDGVLFFTRPSGVGVKLDANGNRI